LRIFEDAFFSESSAATKEKCVLNNGDTKPSPRAISCGMGAIEVDEIGVNNFRKVLLTYV